ncbi:uncharacterized protein BDZ99DRAFT_211306 [Mytilinidion resinicola]|uniref:Uncharacterized protein n=1 Tax=Mytilinidion resinicola TaxID=574789 RepID=A0A6A6XZC4_9PEZI|nr:uncharacterized protein BDZ99DRAFT_211306 [Mytilinidion resinicola]KAF2801926.1 hypothetical protein BDZ99DRAFT_211306 [Mytilinidion resinicola]
MILIEEERFPDAIGSSGPKCLKSESTTDFHTYSVTAGGFVGKHHAGLYTLVLNDERQPGVPCHVPVQREEIRGPHLHALVDFEVPAPSINPLYNGFGYQNAPHFDLLSKDRLSSSFRTGLKHITADILFGGVMPHLCRRVRTLAKPLSEIQGRLFRNRTVLLLP